jgi:hypothetical protein
VYFSNYGNKDTTFADQTQAGGVIWNVQSANGYAGKSLCSAAMVRNGLIKLLIIVRSAEGYAGKSLCSAAMVRKISLLILNFIAQY